MNPEENVSTTVDEKKESILFKNLDLAFDYIFIFLVGVGIVLFMTNYLNDKVKEFTKESLVYSNR